MLIIQGPIPGKSYLVTHRNNKQTAVILSCKVDRGLGWGASLFSATFGKRFKTQSSPLTGATWIVRYLKVATCLLRYNQQPFQTRELSGD